MTKETVTVRFWSSPEIGDNEFLETEMEIPAPVIEKLKNKSYAFFELTLNKSAIYVFHRIDFGGEMPIIDVIPRLN